MPPIKCTPCRLSFGGQRYRIYSDGSVSLALSEQEVRDLGLNSVREVLTHEAEKLERSLPNTPSAKLIRREASRLRRNRNARERNVAMRSLGMTKTPFGWE